jgi:hypothetical protein
LFAKPPEFPQPARKLVHRIQRAHDEEPCPTGSTRPWRTDFRQILGRRPRAVTIASSFGHSGILAKTSASTCGAQNSRRFLPCPLTAANGCGHAVQLRPASTNHTVAARESLVACSIASDPNPPIKARRSAGGIGTRAHPDRLSCPRTCHRVDFLAKREFLPWRRKSG